MGKMVFKNAAAEQNASLKEAFKSSRKLLGKLWDELNVTLSTRHSFASDYFYPETAANYQAICTKIQELATIRNTQNATLKMIEQREIFVKKLERIVHLFNPYDRSIRQVATQSEIINLVLKIRKITCRVVMAITLWRQEQHRQQRDLQHGLPFLHRQQNYLTKLRSDLAFLRHSSFLEFLGGAIHVDDNPFLLPRLPTHTTTTTAEVGLRQLGVVGLTAKGGGGTSTGSRSLTSVSKTISTQLSNAAAATQRAFVYTEDPRIGGGGSSSSSEGNSPTQARRRDALLAALFAPVYSNVTATYTRRPSEAPAEEGAAGNGYESGGEDGEHPKKGKGKRVVFPRENANIGASFCTSPKTAPDGGLGPSTGTLSPTSGAAVAASGSISVDDKVSFGDLSSSTPAAKTLTTQTPPPPPTLSTASPPLIRFGEVEYAQSENTKWTKFSSTESSAAVPSRRGGKPAAKPVVQVRANVMLASLKSATRAKASDGSSRTSTPTSQGSSGSTATFYFGERTGARKPARRPPPPVDEYLAMPQPMPWTVASSRSLLSHEIDPLMPTVSDKYLYPYEVMVAASSNPNMPASEFSRRVVSFALTPYYRGGGSSNKRVVTHGIMQKAEIATYCQQRDVYREVIKNRYVLPTRIPPSSSEIRGVYHEGSVEEKVRQAAVLLEHEVSLATMIRCERLIFEEEEYLRLKPMGALASSREPRPDTSYLEELSQLVANAALDEEGEGSEEGEDEGDDLDEELVDGLEGGLQ